MHLVRKAIAINNYTAHRIVLEVIIFSKCQFVGFLTKCLVSHNSGIFFVQILINDTLLRLTNGGQDPRLSLVVSVCSNSQTDFVRARVLLVSLDQAKDGVRWSSFNSRPK